MKYNGQLAHAIYKKLVEMAKKRPGALVQQHTLQLEVAVAAGALRFAISETDASVPRRATEQRLNQNDVFVATKVGLFLKEELSTNPGQALLQTYNNNTAFTVEAGFVTLAHLVSIWNSKLSIKVADREYAKAIDMSKSIFIPQTQQSAAGNFSQRDIHDGYFDLEPIVAFEGQEANEITLRIPTFTGQQIQKSTANNGLTIYAVLKFDGFLISQGSGLAKATAQMYGLQ